MLILSTLSTYFKHFNNHFPPKIFCIKHTLTFNIIFNNIYFVTKIISDNWSLSFALFIIKLLAK